MLRSLLIATAISMTAGTLCAQTPTPKNVAILEESAS